MSKEHVKESEDYVAEEDEDERAGII